jgi:hypothetical protein
MVYGGMIMTKRKGYYSPIIEEARIIVKYHSFVM